MKFLLSIVSQEEAKSVLKYHPDLLDVKNPDEGSLGAQFPWVIQDVVKAVRNTDIKCSATLGDLPFKPGTASLAAMGAAAACGADYIKAGMFGIKSYEEALQMMINIRKSIRQVSGKILVVASGYADYRRFGAINPLEIIRAASDSKCDAVMVDTAIKDGENLFDAMTYSQLKSFIDTAHNSGLQVALAGSISLKYLDIIAELKPDIIGIRGAVCQKGNRNTALDPIKVEGFIEKMKSLQSKSSYDQPVF